MHPIVTIIMPVFNAEKHLNEAIDSVLNQSYQYWELICVNDGSSDNSQEILDNYRNADPRVRIFSQQNSGPALARKLGISHSNGDYISYLDADDKLSLDYLFLTVEKAISTGADAVMPTLVALWGSDGCYNFNERNNLKIGDEIGPKDAFSRTFPWTVHGLNLYRAAHMKKYALSTISELDTFNADEYLTRHLLIKANKIVICGGVLLQAKQLITDSKVLELAIPDIKNQ